MPGPVSPRDTDQSLHDEITAIDGDLLPPPVDRPTFHEELEFLAAAESPRPDPV